jgi:hypothetical protein
MHLTVFSIKLKFVNSLRRTSPSHFISGLNPNMLLNLMQIFRSRQGSIRSIMFFTCTTVCCCGFDYSFSYFSFTMLWEALGLREISSSFKDLHQYYGEPTSFGIFD